MRVTHLVTVLSVCFIVSADLYNDRETADDKNVSDVEDGPNNQEDDDIAPPEISTEDVSNSEYLSNFPIVEGMKDIFDNSESSTSFDVLPEVRDVSKRQVPLGREIATNAYQGIKPPASWFYWSLGLPAVRRSSFVPRLGKRGYNSANYNSYQFNPDEIDPNMHLFLREAQKRQTFIPRLGKKSLSFTPRLGKKSLLVDDIFENQDDSFMPDDGLSNFEKRPFSFSPRLGKKAMSFTPRLGKKSVGFSPRLGKKSVRFSPRLGKKAVMFSPRLGKRSVDYAGHEMGQTSLVQ